MTRLAPIIALCTLTMTSGVLNAWGAEPVPFAWDGQTLDRAASLPVQDGGRVKPLSTYATFKLLKFNGRRKCTTTEGYSVSGMDRLRDRIAGRTIPDGRILSPTEWLLDTLFFPDTARQYPVFLIEDTDALDAAGIPHEGKKRRDRFSYASLEVGREKLREVAAQYAATPPAQRTYDQSQLVNLDNNLAEYEQLMGYFDFARHSYRLDREAIPAAVQNRFSSILENAYLLRVILAVADHGLDTLRENLGEERTQQLRSMLGGGDADLDPATRERLGAAVRELLTEVDALAGRTGALALIPPSDKLQDQESWLTPADLMSLTFLSQVSVAEELAMLRALEGLAAARGDADSFRSAFEQFYQSVTERAHARGEYRAVPLEVTFYRLRLFFFSQWLFVACFVFVALLWMRPESRRLHIATGCALLVPTALLAAGITMRCVIRARPPVTTLYETILFVTAVAVLIALVAECLDRRRIALSLAALLGVVGMFVANKYEAREAADTMPSMVAVLDTNFWLSTHVTTIVMGYAAGLLAGALGHVYVLLRLLSPDAGEDNEAHRSVARMTYGVLCFGLVFAIIGTVFGGIWAAESWGRFWGWDPKENGALMIVLWLCAVLHARAGGYIRDYGICVGAILGMMVIVFSWWGINLLGVGLHSYGFTSGIFRILASFYIAEILVLLLAFVAWQRSRARLARA